MLYPSKEQKLQQTMKSRLSEIFLLDSAREYPVVQTISLFFWQNISRWARQIALVPEPFVIAISGASGSGKSFVREVLIDRLSQVCEVSSLLQDNYYRDFEADFPHLPLERFYDEIDLDDPAHICFGRLFQDMQALKNLPLGSAMQMQKLQFGTPVSKPTILENAVNLKVTPFVVTEGIHAFYDPAVLPLYDLKIYVDIDENTRRDRWLERNRQDNRGTTDNMWNTTVDCLEKYILPARHAADIVLNNRASQEQVVTFLEEVVSILASPVQLAQQGDVRRLA